jgi:hypothetical protein
MSLDMNGEKLTTQSELKEKKKFRHLKTGLNVQAVQVLIASSDTRRPYRYVDINIVSVEVSIYVQRDEG